MGSLKAEINESNCDFDLQKFIWPSTLEVIVGDLIITTDDNCRNLYAKGD